MNANTAIINIPTFDKKEPEFIQFAREGRVAGQIIYDGSVSEKDLRSLREIDVPVVLIDRKAGKHFPVVKIDYCNATKEAIKNLIKLGHERIGVITGSSKIYEFSEKLRGYEEALHEYSMPYNERLIKNDSGVPIDKLLGKSCRKK